MIKLIIWDLDGILWSDSLAESGYAGTINSEAIEFIKQTEKNGIVHSICSKNNIEQAKNVLIELGIWEYFIFPEISFTPKGPVVKSIIQRANLREENVLFVDDNIINIKEVKYFCPNINCEQDTFFIKSFEIPIGKSRTSQYKILEQKILDSQNKSNLDFLKDCGINIVIYKPEPHLGMEYFERITELVNRSNQLNFTKNRIKITDEIMMPYASFILSNKCYVFAWDKYGYYGLVGFFSDRQGNEEIEYFVFSCRIMNMGIENFCSQYIRDILKWKQNYVIENNGDYSYIKLNQFNDFEGFIREQESLPKKEGKILAMLDSGCQAGPIIGFSKIDHLITLVDLDYTFKDINTTDLPKIYIVSANKFMGAMADKPNIIECINNMFLTMKRADIKILLLIPLIKNPPNHNMKLVYETLQKAVDNLYVYKFEVNLTQHNEQIMDYYHWNRKSLYDISVYVREFVINSIK